MPGEPTSQMIADVLLRNGLADVAETSDAVASVMRSDAQWATHKSAVEKAITRDLAFRSGKSKGQIADLLIAQLQSQVVADLELDSTAPDAVIFVATDLEFVSVTNELKLMSEGLDANGNWLTCGRSPAGRVAAVVKTGQGNIASASVATSVLQASRPRIAVFAGVAGGLWEQEIGAVVIASNIHDYESTEDGLERLSRAKSQPIDHALLQIAGVVARSGVPQVISIEVRPIVSGEKLVTDTSNATSSWIRTVASDAALVEMEGLGMVSAANSLGVPAVVVRGVSDHRQDKDGNADAKNQPIAARAAAKTAVALIDKYLAERDAA